MSLKDLLQAKRAFDTASACEDAKKPWSANPSDCHFIGMKHQHAKDQRLFELLIDVAAAADDWLNLDAEKVVELNNAVQLLRAYVAKGGGE